MSQHRQLVLASTSRYRRDLLERLRLEFDCAGPQVDETPHDAESPDRTALRLSVAKAQAVAAAYPDALIIGADQVAWCEGRRLDKPGNHENAVAQLTWLSGRAAHFTTAVSVLDSSTGRIASRQVPCRVNFRPLAADRIEAYLRKEQPYDCAGSAKAEGLGIALIARIETDDPTALIGLPLIGLTELLEEFGVSPV